MKSFYSKISNMFSDGRPEFFLFLVAMLFIALSLRLVFIFLFDAEMPAGDDSWYYLRLAERLLHEHVYREGDLVAYRPPFFPAYIAAIQFFWGESLEAVRYVQALLGTVFCLLIYFLASWFGGRLCGVIAMIFSAIYPPFIYYSTQILSENLFICLEVLAVVSFLYSISKNSGGLAGFSGVVFGFAALTREVGMLLMLITVIWGMCWGGGVMRVRIRRSFIVVSLMVVTVSPWTVRNYEHFGSFVPISTNGGINFYIGNNPEASGLFHWALAPGVVWNKPSENGLYERQAGSLGFQKGVEFIRDNPRRFVALTVKRAWLMVAPPYKLDLNGSIAELAYRSVWLFMYIVSLTLGFLLLPLVYRHHKNAVIFLYMAMVVLMAPYFITYVISRYQLPVMPFQIVAASLVVKTIGAKYFDRLRLFLNRSFVNE